MGKPEPTRTAGLEQLAAFVPRSGRTYAAERNVDRGPGRHTSVSMLSPYLRHRLVLEREVLTAVTERFAPSTAEKFIAEVYWRAYFKGFLERHPSIWSSYKRDVQDLTERRDKLRPLANDLTAAESGETGIDCFDHWARELVTTGYLHNHARMWFASIWIFTLGLPWQLGADFFQRHLMDGDPASNTLSWRWVAGLHTKGKHYIARPDNIARYTEGRFQPKGLNLHALPLEEDEDHPLRPVPAADGPPAGATLWLATEEDCALETLALPERAGTCGLFATAGRSPGPIGEAARTFQTGAVADQMERLDGASPEPFTVEALLAAVQQAGVHSVTTAYCPVGPAADALRKARPLLDRNGIAVHEVMRQEDPRAWERADRGFFKLKKAIPKLLPPTRAAA